ncbi:MAG: xanthine dehydrogenase small subunit, partial [Alphaproteobacteria bacterium]|nr:xanthine dehydrogenase small subunit [Alphaproteobacteria bacterium]
LPKSSKGQIFRSYKISKRFDQDISAACGAFALKLDGNVVQDIKICFGGLAGVPARAKQAEASLLGADWNEENVQKAMSAMEGDYSPLTDMRASKEYRMTVAKNLLMKFYVETTDQEAETRVVGEWRQAHA